MSRSRTTYTNDMFCTNISEDDQTLSTCLREHGYHPGIVSARLRRVLQGELCTAVCGEQRRLWRGGVDNTDVGIGGYRNIGCSYVVKFAMCRVCCGRGDRSRENGRWVEWSTEASQSSECGAGRQVSLGLWWVAHETHASPETCGKIVQSMNTTKYDDCQDRRERLA